MLRSAPDTLMIDPHFGSAGAFLIALDPQRQRADGIWLTWPTTARRLYRSPSMEYIGGNNVMFGDLKELAS